MQLRLAHPATSRLHLSPPPLPPPSPAPLVLDAGCPTAWLPSCDGAASSQLPKSKTTVPPGKLASFLLFERPSKHIPCSLPCSLLCSSWGLLAPASGVMASSAKGTTKALDCGPLLSSPARRLPLRYLYQPSTTALLARLVLECLLLRHHLLFPWTSLMLCWTTLMPVAPAQHRSPPATPHCLPRL